jgi:hypothetical protein
MYVMDGKSRGSESLQYIDFNQEFRQSNMGNLSKLTFRLELQCAF